MTPTTACGGPTTSGSTPPSDTGVRRNSPNRDSSSKDPSVQHNVANPGCMICRGMSSGAMRLVWRKRGRSWRSAKLEVSLI